MNLEEKIKEVEEKVDMLTGIVLDYLDFWVNGTALKPIYQEFIERTKQIVL